MTIGIWEQVAAELARTPKAVVFFKPLHLLDLSLVLKVGARDPELPEFARGSVAKFQEKTREAFEGCPTVLALINANADSKLPHLSQVIAEIKTLDLCIDRLEISAAALFDLVTVVQNAIYLPGFPATLRNVVGALCALALEHFEDAPAVTRVIIEMGNDQNYDVPRS